MPILGLQMTWSNYDYKQTADAYRLSKEKEAIAAWIEAVQRHTCKGWSIIVLTRPDIRKMAKIKPVMKAEVGERIRTDFCSRLRDKERYTNLLPRVYGLSASLKGRGRQGACPWRFS